mmetsp:Transcript_15216/g.30543  ORF Transcript_15216/g.30543 Transcript_15216/m.30543 type:complete len:140 (+) Transcript_15216:1248-1667(+)
MVQVEFQPHISALCACATGTPVTEQVYDFLVLCSESSEYSVAEVANMCDLHEDDLIFLNMQHCVAETALLKAHHDYVAPPVPASLLQQVKPKRGERQRQDAVAKREAAEYAAACKAALGTPINATALAASISLRGVPSK